MARRRNRASLLSICPPTNAEKVLDTRRAIRRGVKNEEQRAADLETDSDPPDDDVELFQPGPETNVYDTWDKEGEWWHGCSHSHAALRRHGEDSAHCQRRPLILAHALLHAAPFHRFMTTPIRRSSIVILCSLSYAMYTASQPPFCLAQGGF
jgi:hypothetical protein